MSQTRFAMITFSCTKCGKQFNLKPEFAGRKTTCSGCKAPLTVPTAETTLAYAPIAKELKGTRSVAEAGLDAGVTLAGDFATAEALSMQNLIDGKAKDTRYVVESELARGGMGAVMRAVD